MDIESIITQLSKAAEIKVSDIPDIDLYMDQVTTFIDSKLENDKRDKKDKLLTKTMINNYSKAKILAPSKNKRYNKQQMIQLILIYYLKQVLSINDIQALFHPLFQLTHDEAGLIDDIYSTYLKIKKDSMGSVHDMLKGKNELITQATDGLEGSKGDTMQLLLTVLLLSAQSLAYKRTAEAIIDKHFKPSTS